MLLPFSAVVRASASTSRAAGPASTCSTTTAAASTPRSATDGWPGCTVFECFGAGQQVSQVTYAGVSWREQDNLAEMGAVLSVMRQLHEMLVHLARSSGARLTRGHGGARPRSRRSPRADPEALLTFDLDDLHERVGRLLADASTRLRARGRQRRPVARGGPAGRRLSGDHRGGVVPRGDPHPGGPAGPTSARSDLLGADLRDADLRGSDLSTAMFLTQLQVNAAVGDARTSLPPGLQRPPHWAH